MKEEGHKNKQNRCFFLYWENDRETFIELKSTIEMRKIEVLNIKDNIRETGVEDIQNCIDDVKILTNVQMAKKEDKEKTVMDDMAEGEIVERIKED